MKTIAWTALFIAIAVNSLRADYFSPFAESKVGSTVTSSGQIIGVERKGGGTNYFVRCRVCTGGPTDIPAQIPPSLLQGGLAGRSAQVTATIREREDTTTKSKTRYLEVTKIEVLK